MQKIVLIIALALLLVADIAPAFAGPVDRIEVAQERKRRTLFDLLFGPKEEEVKKPAPAASAPAAPREPVKPIIEKNVNATRVAVFGDSLAIDLAKALDRLYAEDPNLAILDDAKGSSGLVRDDFYDWNSAMSDAIALNSFEVAVIIIGINDRQPIAGGERALDPLSDEWKTRYQERAVSLLNQLRAAGKPAIWVGLPPMQSPSYSGAMTQISSLQKQATFAAGAEFVDVFERFADEEGLYASYGPDLNGQNVQMRKTDGIHFTSAGADKLAFYVNQSLKLFYNGSSISVAIADPLEGTDAQSLLRPPFQGLGQIRLLEVAGAVRELDSAVIKSDALIEARSGVGNAGIDLSQMMAAPEGRADAFGAGIKEDDDKAEPDATAQ